MYFSDFLSIFSEMMTFLSLASLRLFAAASRSLPSENEDVTASRRFHIQHDLQFLSRPKTIDRILAVAALNSKAISRFASACWPIALSKAILLCYVIQCQTSAVTSLMSKPHNSSKVDYESAPHEDAHSTMHFSRNAAHLRVDYWEHFRCLLPLNAILSDTITQMMSRL